MKKHNEKLPDLKRIREFAQLQLYRSKGSVLL